MSIPANVLGLVALFFTVMVPLLIWSDTREIRREVIALRKEIAEMRLQLQAPSRQIFSPLADDAPTPLHKRDRLHQL